MNEIKNENNVIKKGDINKQRVAVWTVNGRDHKMKLSTLAITRLENRLNTNLLNVLNERQGLPKLGNMLQIVCEGMKAYDKGMTIEKTVSLFDKYVEEGNCQTDFAYGPFIDLYKASGFFPEKNQGAVEDLQRDLIEKTRKDL